MSDDGSANQGSRTREKLPKWFGYAFALAAQAAVTAGVALLLPELPTAKSSAPYIICVLVAAYLFGDGPAVVATLAGLVALAWSFGPGSGAAWALPAGARQWASTAVYLVGSVGGTFVISLLSRYSRRVERLAFQLRVAKELAERRRSELETVLLSASDAIIVVNPDSTIAYANEAADRVFCTPLRRQEPIGLLVEAASIREPDGTPAAVHELAVMRALCDGITSDKVLLVNGESGPSTVLSVHASPIRRPDGEIGGAVAIIRDVTEQTRASDELKRGYERERRIAQTLQTSLMRPVPRRIGGFVFEKLYRAAWEEARIGGDFYDVFPLDDDMIGIVIGDVSGKGLKAAVQVAAAKYSLRGRAYECQSPGAVMEQVNRTLVQDMEAEGFASVFLGILDCRRSALRYANAGHAPVMFWRASESRAVLFEPTGPVTGIYNGATFGEIEVALDVGDELLLGTDGLYEVRCEGSFLEIDRLLDIYNEIKARGMSSATELVDRVVEFCRGDLRDDIAVLRVSVEECASDAPPTGCPSAG